MAYLNSNTTFVEINKSTPMHFRLNKQLIGLDSFKVFLQNKETIEITELTNAKVQEYNVFTEVAKLNGAINPGVEKITVTDSSLINVGDVIRFGNEVYTVTGVDQELHEIFLDKLVCNGYADQTPVVKVEYPDFLGCYWLKINISKLGNYIVNVVDKSGSIIPIMDDVQVVSSLANPTFSGFNGGVISGKGMIG